VSEPEAASVTAPSAQPRGRRALRRWMRRVRRAFVALLGVAALGAVALAVLVRVFPFEVARLDAYPASRVVLDRDGAWLRVERSVREEFRVPVAIAEISPWLVEATIAVEDRNFRSHPGVDPCAVLRASWQNLRRGRIHSGASTLTMQLVRIVDERPRTLANKFVEAIGALQIDAELDKDRVVEAYLNLAPYGGNLRGVEAAARRYFGQSARELDLAQAAMLAGLPQSPSRLRPDRHYERARARSHVVLDAMLREGRIDAAQHARAVASSPLVRQHDWPFVAPHFAELALRAPLPSSGGVDVSGDLAGHGAAGHGAAADGAAADGAAADGAAGHGAADVRRRSTLDRALQSSVEARAGEFLAHATRRADELGVAVVVIDVEASAVRALVGSADFVDGSRAGQVNGALARRSSGSTLKPFLWAHAYDRGVASPATRLADVPATFRDWVPENFDRRYHGPVAAAEALSRSLNVPAVRLQQAVGSASFAAILGRLGLATIDRPASHYGLALALGGAEVRLLDLANAYAALVRGGVWRELRVLEAAAAGVAGVAGAAGAARGERVFGEDSSRLVIDALIAGAHLDAVLAADGGGAASWLAGRVGCKTGTSFGLRDAWTIAFSPRWIAGVWLGVPSGRARADLIGGELAAPLALAVVAELARGDDTAWPEPAAIVETEVCALSGFPLSDACPAASLARAGASALRLPRCRVHRTVLVDPERDVEVCARCVGKRSPRRETIEAWSPEVERWLRAQGQSRHVRAHDAECAAQRTTRLRDHRAAPRILSPADGARYRYVEGAAFAQRLRLAAATSPDASRLFWFVDDELLVATDGRSPALWDLRAGRHRLRCVDDRGRGSAVTVEVER